MEGKEAVVGAGWGGVAVVELTPGEGGRVKVPRVAQVLNAVETAVQDEAAGDCSARVVLPAVRLAAEDAMQPQVRPVKALQVEHGADVVGQQVPASNHKQLVVYDAASAALPAAEIVGVHWHDFPPPSSGRVERPHIVKHALAVFAAHDIKHSFTVADAVMTARRRRLRVCSCGKQRRAAHDHW